MQGVCWFFMMLLRNNHSKTYAHGAWSYCTCPSFTFSIMILLTFRGVLKAAALTRPSDENFSLCEKPSYSLKILLGLSSTK